MRHGASNKKDGQRVFLAKMAFEDIPYAPPVSMGDQEAEPVRARCYNSTDMGPDVLFTAWNGTARCHYRITVNGRTVISRKDGEGPPGDLFSACSHNSDDEPDADGDEEM